ncbi:MAG: YfjI family protein [Candidatus Sphingomonas colombiensis]|nr:YfjI family protein [Sphingomonas sp.]WEK44738.1 MAG: YfjI family protein [Sphingomonas sp.]
MSGRFSLDRPTMPYVVDDLDRDWPEPSPLGDELLPVAPCCVDMLPTALGPWLGDIAERMNVPLDMVAIPALVAAGGLIGRRVGIRPQQHTDWQEAGNLWGCVVAPPGAKKSPAASEALGPLRALESGAAQANAAAMAEHELAKRVHKLASEVAESAARKAIKAGGDAMAAMRTAPAPDAPTERRFLTSDATAEKLGEICAANPLGVMVHRDELLSLFADLDREERASARGFFLSGWNGSESYTFDRIARGTIRIPAVNISLFGTTQPDRLARYMADSLQRFNDGMVQRLQLLAWPDFAGAYVECDRAALSAARQVAWRFHRDIADLDTQELRAEWDDTAGPGHFPFLRFAPDAQTLFSRWIEGLEQKLRGGDLEPALMAHLAKYRGLVPRLALLCHIASDAAGPVSRDALDMAVRWGDYLESHARRAYGALSLDNASAARAIWRRVTRGHLPRPFTARDIQRKGWSGLAQKERVEAGLKALCDADWLTSDTPDAGPGGGRPSKLYRPNSRALTRSYAGQRGGGDENA